MIKFKKIKDKIKKYWDSMSYLKKITASFIILVVLLILVSFL